VAQLTTVCKFTATICCFAFATGRCLRPCGPLEPACTYFITLHARKHSTPTLISHCKLSWHLLAFQHVRSLRTLQSHRWHNSCHELQCNFRFEVFLTNQVCCFQFTCLQVSEGMRSLGASVYLLTVAVGTYLASGLNVLVAAASPHDTWVSNNPLFGHYDW
jgi:hypothetical protein